MKEEKFPHSRKPSHRHVCGELWSLRGQHNQGKKKKTQNTHLTTTTTREVTLMFASTSSEWGLGREAQAASLVLRVRTGPKFPEGNLRELM